MKKFILISILFLGALMQAKKIDFIEIHNQKIPLIFEQSSLIPTGFVRLAFIGGGSINDKDLSGLASLGSKLLNEGTKSLGSIRFAQELEKRAISLYASSGLETLNLELNFLKEKQNEALDLLQDLLLDPNYTQDTLDKIKQKAINSLLVKQNDFDYLANENLAKILFTDTPLAQSPSKESLQKITLEDLKSYLNANLTLSRLVIVVGGDMEQAHILPKLTKILQKLSVGTPTPAQNYSANANATTSMLYKDTQQAYIYFGSPFVLKDLEAESYKAKILGFVLGASGFGSRLMEEIRVKRGLAYSAYLRIHTGKIANYASGYLQTKLENQSEAIKLVKQIVADFVREGITQDELESAKRFLLGSDPLRRETLAQRLNAEFQNYYLGLPLNFDKIQLNQIQDITLEQINTYIKEHVELNDLSFSIVTTKDKK